jgi:hypothetical protein
MPQSFRLRYIRYQPVFMKLKLRIGQKNVLVFALIVRRLWKRFRLPKQRLLWYDSARRHWMISLPDMLWGYIGPWTCRSERKWNCWQAHEGWFCSTVCWTWAFLGFSRKNIRRKMKRWMENPHLVLWRGPCSIQRQAWELISSSDLTTRTWLLSFNRTQSRIVIGLLTGHNTLRRHLYIMGLSNKPICRKCGTEEETSVHILCECQALASLRHTYLGSFFLDPEDIRKLTIGAIWNATKGKGLL